MVRRNTTVQRRQALYDEAVAIIERDYPRQIDLNTVAAEIATSRRQLQRAFAEVGRTSFRTRLAQVRMRHALDLLRAGELPVRQVAHSVGYRQPAQFAKTFRRHHGASPSSVKHSNAAAADG
jgi:AraC family transcriptional regulator of adaptative response / methylphosphotriester-DNA alkyltransferase methyltransferase